MAYRLKSKNKIKHQNSVLPQSNRSYWAMPLLGSIKSNKVSNRLSNPIGFLMGLDGKQKKYTLQGGSRVIPALAPEKMIY